MEETGRGEVVRSYPVLNNAKAVFVDGTVFADRQCSFKKFAVDSKSLLGCLNAVKAIGDPFRADDGLCFSIHLEARGDFTAPVIDFSKEENGIGWGGSCFSSHFFETIFKVCPDAAWQKDGKIEVEFSLSFDEPIKSIGHLRLDIRILFLLIDNASIFSAEIDDVCTRENAELFGDAIAHFHRSRASSSDEREWNLFAKKGMMDCFSHV